MDDLFNMILSRSVNKTDINGTDFPLKPIDSHNLYPMSIILAKPAKLAQVKVQGKEFNVSDSDEFVMEVRFLNPVTAEEESSIYTGVSV